VLHPTREEWPERYVGINAIENRNKSANPNDFQFVCDVPLRHDLAPAISKVAILEEEDTFVDGELTSHSLLIKNVKKYNQKRHHLARTSMANVPDPGINTVESARKID
jgi:hypothetical protein